MWTLRTTQLCKGFAVLGRYRISRLNRITENFTFRDDVSPRPVTPRETGYQPSSKFYCLAEIYDVSLDSYFMLLFIIGCTNVWRSYGSCSKVIRFCGMWYCMPLYSKVD